MRKKIAFIAPVGEWWPKILYRDLVDMLTKEYPEFEYFLVSSKKEWLQLHFFNNQYDVIISSIPFFWKPPKCTYIIQQHGLYKNDRWFTSIAKLLNWLYPYNNRFSKIVLYPSEFLKRYYNSNHQDQRVIYNIFQVPKNIVPKEYAWAKKSLIFTTVTNFHFYDKARWITDICSKLWNLSVGKKITYYICGWGRYKQKIASEIKKLAIPSNVDVIFLWNINRKEVLDLLKKTDIFLYSTFQETFGMAIIEAMSFWIPVILNNYTLFYELYDDDFIAKDDQDFVSTLERLIDDKQYYRLYMEKSKINIQKFNPNLIVSNWIDLFRSLLWS